jgi:ABC transport system ATP-binding/permease protein
LAPIINAQGLSKRFGVAPLFQNISFTISAGDRIGLIGPNGSGKSTLLEIIAGRMKPDSGEVASRKGTSLSYVQQISEFAGDATCRKVIESVLARIGVDEIERGYRAEQALDRAGFRSFDALANSLSGGWRKRLAIVEGIVQEPDILLLDEPTNHLDLEGIEWLETVLQSSPFACVVVSHDRYFLESVTNDMVELSRFYADGYLRVRGNYSKFLEAKELHLDAQGKRQDALKNIVHTEIEWLRRGPKARTTKSKSRIDKAHEMIGELADLNTRTRSTAAKIDFTASDRQTKQLITLNDVSYAVAGRTLFSGLTFTLTNGTRVGLVGPNGSGKTTLLRLIRGDEKPATGKIAKADGLRIVYFDQKRELDPNISLRRALAPDSDSVIYQDRVIHVGAWAARFLFVAEDLNRPVGRLSGGERARVLIAQLMLQPADVLLLDEPTNDLDIPTLEILEESLLEYPGALLLVTHDRFMLDRVSTTVLGLDGNEHIGRFADYAQWEEWMVEQENAVQSTAKSPATLRTQPTPSPSAPTAQQKRAADAAAREAAKIEKRIVEAEATLASKRATVEDPAIASDAAKLHTAYDEMQAAQTAVDKLYEKWSQFEKK